MSPAPDVVGPAEARELLGGISRQRFAQLVQSGHVDAGPFPEPRELEIGRVYDRAEMVAWQQSRTEPRRRMMIGFLRIYRATGNVSRSARAAGIHVSTGRRWLAELGVPTPSQQ